MLQKLCQTGPAGPSVSSKFEHAGSFSSNRNSAQAAARRIDENIPSLQPVVMHFAVLRKPLAAIHLRLLAKLFSAVGTLFAFTFASRDGANSSLLSSFPVKENN